MDETERSRMLNALARAVSESGFVSVRTSGSSVQAISKEGKNCPVCSSPPEEHRVVNQDPVTRLGEVQCTRCTSFVRIFDPT